MVTVDTSLGSNDSHADVVEPRSSEVARGDALALVSPGGPCLDLVVCSPCLSLPGSTAPGDAVPTLRSLGTMDPGVTELGFPSYPSA
jgi:hypothetical protein